MQFFLSLIKSPMSEKQLYLLYVCCFPSPGVVLKVAIELVQIFEIWLATYRDLRFLQWA